MIKQKTVIKFILDRTGSMSAVRDETIAGFNEYIKTLREDKNEKLISLSLVQFDTEGIDTLYEDSALSHIKDLSRKTYKPRANTNLYDAVGKGVRDLETKLAKRRAIPAVIFVVMTDGHENASREYNRKSIYDLIQEKTKEGWVFTYLSSEADAWDASSDMGISGQNTAQYLAGNPGRAFAGMAEANSAYAMHVSMDTADMVADSALSGFDFGGDAQAPEKDAPESQSVAEAKKKAREKANSH